MGTKKQRNDDTHNLDDIVGEMLSPYRGFATSTHCDTSSCVSVSRLSDGRVAVQDSKDPSRGVLLFDKGEWQAFVRGVKDSEFDIA